jgi:hypothetical protein
LRRKKGGRFTGLQGHTSSDKRVRLQVSHIRLLNYLLTAICCCAA